MRRIGTILVLAGVAGCGHDQVDGMDVPEGPAARIDVLAATDRDLGPLPPATEPIRRGPCGTPLTLSIEGMFAPQGLLELHRALVDRGLLDPAAARLGELDEATIRAIMKLQEREELPVVGIPTYATVRALGLEPTKVFVTGDPTCRVPKS